MLDIRLIRPTEIPVNLIADIDQRQVALWIRSLPDDAPNVLDFLRLPWRLVLLEAPQLTLINALEDSATPIDPLVNKRGFIQVIDRDPSHIELPQRCLPVYLLNGRQASIPNDFQSRYRRMSMLEVLRRSDVRHLLILSSHDEPVPPDLTDLWHSGFRSSLVFVTDAPDAGALLSEWADATDGLRAAALLQQTVSAAIADLLDRYHSQHPEAHVVIRVHDRSGDIRPVVVTELDDPERPILDAYRLIQERDVVPLTPDQLSEEEFIAFFQNPETSWRPYAANLPWERENRIGQRLRDAVKKIDAGGPDETALHTSSPNPVREARLSSTRSPGNSRTMVIRHWSQSKHRLFLTHLRWPTTLIGLSSSPTIPRPMTARLAMKCRGSLYSTACTGSTVTASFAAFATRCNGRDDPSVC